MKKIIVFSLLMTHSFGQQVALPPFKTTNGTEIKNAKVLSMKENSVKLMHEGGITTLSSSDFPDTILAVLGMVKTEASPDAIPLPETLTVKGREYRNVKLTGIDPDGIRILHAEGGGKLIHEDLPSDLLLTYGPFDPRLAASFREQQKEMQRELYKIKLGAIKSENTQIKQLQGRSQSSIQSEDGEASPLENSSQASSPISTPVYVELSGSSLGGKSRSTPFETNYGSYVNEDISSRSMLCQIKSLGAAAQRVRVQCLLITRPLSGGRLVATVVGDSQVELGSNAVKSVSATAIAKSTDQNYVALGQRIKSGEKYVGWCWRAIDGANRICTVSSSIPHYDRFAWQTALE